MSKSVRAISGNGQDASTPSERQQAEQWLNTFLNGSDGATIPEIFHVAANSVLATYGTFAAVPVAVTEVGSFEDRAELAYQNVPKPDSETDAADLIDAVQTCNKPRSKDNRKFPYRMALRQAAAGICVEKGAETSEANISHVSKLIEEASDPEVVAAMRKRIARELTSIVNSRRARRAAGGKVAEVAPTLTQDFDLKGLSH